tara:strand:+ start:136 stop:555 length:420 start_codon:yes stop_codon:yes gene_type:complete
MSTTIYHSHHIIPKHAGGTDEPTNLIRLTIDEHAEAHRVLYEKYNRWQDKLAWKSLSGMIDKKEILWEIYHRPRSDEHKKNQSKNHADVSGKNNPMYGKKQSARNKEALKKANTGRKMSPETRKKMSDSMKGRVPWNKK